MPRRPAPPRDYGSPASRLRFLARQWWYDLRTGLLFRPALLTAAYALAGLLLPRLEQHPAVAPLVQPWSRALFDGEPGAAQLVLTTIASSAMTTVSVVYSVLLMALSLASVQFSPRILGSFLRSGTSQTTLGVFIGTFTYCLLVLRAVRVEPPTVPALAVAVALGLALLCLGMLIWALHDLATSIQANHIADRIAGETEIVLDAVLPTRSDAEPLPAPPIPAEAWPVPAPRSGYVQLIGEADLLALATSASVVVHVPVMEGEFVVEGEPLAFVEPATALDPALDPALVAALQADFDLGPVRTMQHDAEFGVRQIVDIALKATSPAVNDPSTAVTCIDQLARVLCRAVRRGEPAAAVADGRGVVRVWRRRPTAARLVDLAFNQLRQYGKGDMAVTLRLLRTLVVVSHAAQRPADLERLRHHGELLAAAAQAHFDAADTEELRRRLAELRGATAGLARAA